MAASGDIASGGKDSAGMGMNMPTVSLRPGWVGSTLGVVEPADPGPGRPSEGRLQKDHYRQNMSINLMIFDTLWSRVE
jgi:hypothetical protein